MKITITQNAKNKISKFKDLKKVAITWSYWKSTIKEFLSQIFENKFSVIKTPKNQNTPLWISDLILKKMDNTFEYFFCEMWAYKQWEIEELWNIVNHKYWFLTWIGNQHLSLFWSQSNIILWKTEIAKKIFENNWVLYVNWDNFFCRKAEFQKWLNIIFYWLDSVVNSVFSEILDFSEKWMTFIFNYKWEKYEFFVDMIWKHNISNLTWVLAFAFDQWMDYEEIKNSLKILKTPEKNLELIKKDFFKNWKNEDLFLINDTYNINYNWVLSACESLDVFKNSKKILVLDDILELWKDSRKIHIELWKELSKFDFDEICLIWREFRSSVEKWLLEKEFPEEKIFFNFVFDFLEENLPKNNEKQIFLFEWMHSEKFLNRILEK